MENDALNAETSDEYCQTCRELDFAKLSESCPIPGEGLPVASIGVRPKDLSTVSCPSCRFFLAVSTRYKRKYQQHVRLFDHIKQQDPDDVSNDSLSLQPFFSVLRQNSRLSYSSSIEDEIGQMGLVVYQSSIPLEPCIIRTIEEGQVNYEALKSWLSCCQKSHAECNHIDGPGDDLPHLFLIDCIDEKVVQASTDEQYLTLSYVWGNPHNETYAQHVIESKAYEQFNFGDASLTIQDAVRVVRGLDRRYLWVDKYCIRQDNPLMKQLFLRHMDSIYEKSEATIVALDGLNDQTGLPGVSEVQRLPQPRLDLPSGSGYLISSCPRISTVITDSKWATRGWTYQEARLSRRCLFFTRHQVYFVCREQTLSETLPAEPDSGWIPHIMNSTRLNASLFGEHTSIPNGLFRDRLTFTKRALTYESDVLDAFRGILSRSSFQTFWGVPIAPHNSAIDPDVGFALGLLWVRRPERSLPRHLPSGQGAPYRRREEFPTWSWTSIVGEIYNEVFGEDSLLGLYIRGSKSSCPRNDADVHFWVYDSNAEEIPLSGFLKQHPTSILPEFSRRIVVEADIVQVKISRSRRIFRICDGTGKDVLDQDITQLDLNPIVPSKNDQPLLYQHPPNSGWGEEIEEAMVLIEWKDAQKGAKLRLVLMLLEWIAEGKTGEKSKDDLMVAERRGILGEYRQEWDSKELKRVARTRKKFILQ